jgi:hypothetical protein
MRYYRADDSTIAQQCVIGSTFSVAVSALPEKNKHCCWHSENDHRIGGGNDGQTRSFIRIWRKQLRIDRNNGLQLPL